MYLNMLSKTKKDRKSAQLKQFILRSGTITRAEAVQYADLDIRTATSYLEKLCRQGFCRKENSAPDGKGRPGIIYKTNFENMVFAGVLISQNMFVQCVLCTIDGDILKQENWKLNSQQSKLTIFNSILSMVKNIAGDFPDKILGGIGVAVSRWLQPPLATYDLYSGLAKFLEKETKMAVHRVLNINALAYDVANINGQKDISIFHTGNVIELGIIQNGRNIQNYQEHESTLAHLMVNPNGPRCYCGKKGCLENYVTNTALSEKISSITPGASLDDSNSNLKIKKLKDKIVDYLIQACLYLNQTYKSKQIFLMMNDDITTLVARECEKEKLKCKINHLDSKEYSVVRGAALMAAFIAVKQYK